MRIPIRLAAAGSATLALLALVPAGSAAAAPGTPTTSNGIAAAAGWLTTQFANGSHLPAPDGDHFDEYFGGQSYPNYGENADVIFGLAAAKSGAAKVHVALDYLEHNVDAYADISKAQGGPFDGSLGKLALAAIVAGTDPTHFGGYNLLHELQTDECKVVSKACPVVGQALNIYASISEAFVLLAEARAGGAYAPDSDAVTYFDSLQCTSGGFTDGTTRCGSGAADIDSTSYAIMALTALGSGQSAARESAVTWLKHQEKAGGYWVSQGIPNVNSTGLAAAALAGAGVDVTSARKWLRAQQIGAGKPGAGAFAYGGSFMPSSLKGGTSPSVIATAQALPGLVTGGSLATLSAAGSAQGVSLFEPAARLSAGPAPIGSHQTVTADGFAAGETVTVVVHSTPRTVGRATVAADGSVHLTYAVPALTTGAHTLTVTGATSGLSASAPLTITAAAVPTAQPAAHSAAPASAAPIANTGLDGRRLALLGLLGGLLVIAGGVLLLTARRRTR